MVGLSILLGACHASSAYARTTMDEVCGKWHGNNTCRNRLLLEILNELREGEYKWKQ